MFDTGLLDFLVTFPILAPVLFGLLLYKAEGSDSVRPLFSKAFGTALFGVLTALNLFLLLKFSKVSVLVLGGLFKIDKTAATLSLMITGIAMLIYLMSSLNKNFKIKSLELFGLISLVTGLAFANNLIFIFLFSEAILIATVVSKNHKLSLMSLKGSKVRTIGLILLLGAVSVTYGAGNALTINFLQSNAESLYAADHLFVIGCLFMLAGIFEIVWMTIREVETVFDYKTIVGSFALLVLLLKYSSAQLFTYLQDVQDFIQWFAVVLLLMTSLRFGKRKAFLLVIRDAFSVVLLLALIFSLPNIFDGKDSLGYIFSYFTMSTIFAVVLLSLERRLSLVKGADLLLADLPGLVSRQPRRSALIFVALAGLISFPLSPATLGTIGGLRLVMQSGFYWVVCWSLFAFVLLWAGLTRLYGVAYLRAEEKDSWLLWKESELKDLALPKFLVVLAIVVVLPLIVGFLVKL